ncbi:hypothetical protein QBC44DRAFT_317988 [Cladorrhinum sp. PSN332]|nr:hypothetical protein QBC44DRAFT_317988 [Cladorrhinum sp. PSN332]
MVNVYLVIACFSVCMAIEDSGFSFWAFCNSESGLYLGRSRGDDAVSIVSNRNNIYRDNDTIRPACCDSWFTPPLERRYSTRGFKPSSRAFCRFTIKAHLTGQYPTSLPLVIFLQPFSITCWNPMSDAAQKQNRCRLQCHRKLQPLSPHNSTTLLATPTLIHTVMYTMLSQATKT